MRTVLSQVRSTDERLAYWFRLPASMLHAQPQDSLADIAGSLGYCDASAFTKQFKAHFGMTPSRYREMGM